MAASSSTSKRSFSPLFTAEDTAAANLVNALQVLQTSIMSLFSAGSSLPFSSRSVVLVSMLPTWGCKPSSPYKHSEST